MLLSAEAPATCERHVTKPPLTVLLCAPRGFCAGVERAIATVERALALHGAPVYVRHDIVHNRTVVDALKAKGAIFVEALDAIPDATAPVIFSAHGVAKAVAADADARGLRSIDATCPLVGKVHREAEAQYRRGREIVLIGHRGHPEVEGTLGQLPPGAITVIETRDEARAFVPRDPTRLAYVTQTTLSVDEAADIASCLAARFPAIVAPSHQDICYATSNRQQAVKRVAPLVDAMIVVGSAHSSNTRRLAEVAADAGCHDVQRVDSADEIDWAALAGVQRLGLTAGASAPEALVTGILAALATRFAVSCETIEAAVERMAFPLPSSLRAVSGVET